MEKSPLRAASLFENQLFKLKFLFKVDIFFNFRGIYDSSWFSSWNFLRGCIKNHFSIYIPYSMPDLHSFLLHGDEFQMVRSLVSRKKIIGMLKMSWNIEVIWCYEKHSKISHNGKQDFECKKFNSWSKDSNHTENNGKTFSQWNEKIFVLKLHEEIQKWDINVA